MPLTGTVLEREGAVYRVATPEGEVQAVLRGKTKRHGPRVIVGDVVHLELDPQGDLYAIHAVADRRSLLARRVPEGRGERPIVANVDQVLVMTSTMDPPPIPQLIDRLLVIAEANHLSALVVVNKVDLALADALIQRYRDAGYKVFPTSATDGDGVEAIRGQLKEQVSVITGPSGVGKTSLLNSIQPGLALRVGAVSRRVRRGRHTTVSSVMIPLTDGGFLVDTPGFSEVGLWGLPPRELGACFPEFRDYHDACRYADCVHQREPDCAVRGALEEGRIDAERYRSYVTLLEELRAAPKEWE